MVDPNSNKNQPPADEAADKDSKTTAAPVDGENEPLLDPHGFPIGRQTGTTPPPNPDLYKGKAAPPPPEDSGSESLYSDLQYPGPEDNNDQLDQKETEPVKHTPGVLPDPEETGSGLELTEPITKAEPFIDNTYDGEDIPPSDPGRPAGSEGEAFAGEQEEEQEDPRILALQNELDNMRDQALRAIAEAENTRKRSQRERDDASRYSISSFARDMLEISDNLRRGIEAIPEDLKTADPRLENVVEGIEATERNLLKTFERHGIEKLEPLNEIFDPNFHEVMFEAPGTGKPPGTIIQLIEAGYILKDRLLRPARVGVAKDEGQGGGDVPPVSPGGQVDQEV